MTDNPNDTDDLREFPHAERPRGILTKEDRRFLSGMKEVSEQTRRDTRYRIRERVKNALADFELLLNHLLQEDRQTIFESLYEQEPSPARYALGFLYLGTQDVDTDFDSLLAQAINQAMFHEDPGRIIDVSVDIDIETEEPDVEDVVERLIAGEGTIEDFNYATVKGGIIPVLEHYLEKGDDLRVVVPGYADADGIEFPVDELEKMREVYSQFEAESEEQ